MSIPEQCVGVVEVEVELLTGRTHQIRGQLSAEGFPLVGDVPYGGANPLSTFVPFPSSIPSPNESPLTSDTHADKNKDARETQMYPDKSPKRFLDSEKLALQCCGLSFIAPQIKIERNADFGTETTTLVSPYYGEEQWKTFRLDDAWWSPFLHEHRKNNRV